ncbi:hypothetical protein SAMN02745118_02076 [Selenihalanaerobacter shriftii]|uniref:Uncharacterized protein n=2 Tax=Selenihalanaerobacter shriftii TaxID=142842 RepID=A0A1T4P8U1_9FIRM|nr:hypothetical protein SAMN02745118_02076 [Selenihalanaerobacter shriftii]
MLVLKDYNISDCEIKNMLILLGKLSINSYPLIILEHNHQLSSELKELMTTVINNLQIRSQLKNRISELQMKIDSVLKYNENEKQIKLYKNSFNLKNRRLKELKDDNYQLLAIIGDHFFKQRLLSNHEEFEKVYSELEKFLKEGGCIKDSKFNYVNRKFSNPLSKSVNFIKI